MVMAEKWVKKGRKEEKENFLLLAFPLQMPIAGETFYSRRLTVSPFTADEKERFSDISQKLDLWIGFGAKAPFRHRPVEPPSLSPYPFPSTFPDAVKIWGRKKEKKKKRKSSSLSFFPLFLLLLFSPKTKGHVMNF